VNKALRKPMSLLTPSVSTVLIPSLTLFPSLEYILR